MLSNSHALHATYLTMENKKGAALSSTLKYINEQAFYCACFNLRIYDFAFATFPGNKFLPFNLAPTKDKSPFFDTLTLSPVFLSFISRFIHYKSKRFF